MCNHTEKVPHVFFSCAILLVESAPVTEGLLCPSNELMVSDGPQALLAHSISDLVLKQSSQTRIWAINDVTLTRWLEHGSHTTSPHFLQWCFRLNMENATPHTAQTVAEESNFQFFLSTNPSVWLGVSSSLSHPGTPALVFSADGGLA